MSSSLEEVAMRVMGRKERERRAAKKATLESLSLVRYFATRTEQQQLVIGVWPASSSAIKRMHACENREWEGVVWNDDRMQGECLLQRIRTLPLLPVSVSKKKIYHRIVPYGRSFALSCIAALEDVWKLFSNLTA